MLNILVLLARSGVFALLCAILCAGCTQTPGGFASRLTEGGRLLQDGPPARMTASAIAEGRADAVPLLYAFALEAGQVQPTADSTAPFPAVDVNAQQIALLDHAINWSAVTLVGEGYIDTQCNRFLEALNELERSKRGTLANLNAVQAATIGIMGLALAAQNAIGIVAIAFGLTASLIDNTTSVVLYQLPASSVRTIVLAQRDVLRADESEILVRINNQGLASARLSEYVQYCVPVTIEANVASVLNRAKEQNGRIAVDPATPAVTSSLARPITAIPAGTPIIRVVPPAASQTGTIIPRIVHNRLVAFSSFVGGVADVATLQAAAAALQVNANSVDPRSLQANIIGNVNDRVIANAAQAAANMDAVSQLLEPILHQTF
ncbi:MAG TPA: hypothetical protein VFL55_25550 [Acetobacteraceae bacterium]|nr:hypothetical protein [Acetobacteraceae bacterium]